MKLRLAIAILTIATPLNTARADAISVTDDPDFVEYGNYQIYIFSGATRADHKTTGTAAGIEINYGATPNIEVAVQLPFDYDTGADDKIHSVLGPAELGVGYRFVDEDEENWQPQIIFYPSIEASIGGPHDARESMREFLPLWAQKSFGAWTTYAGGGYWNNPGRDNRDYWFFSWTLLRQVSPDLQLGGEIFHQTTDKIGGHDSTGLAVGALYDLSEHFHLVGSVETGLENRRTTNEFSYYFALEWTT